MNAAPTSPSNRILPIDATRGAVMLFSCLAHFAWWIHAAYPDASSELSAIGMVATPTFLMLSGAMVGMLCAGAARSGRDLRSQLLNRGLFLLTVGHILIALAEAHPNGGFFNSMRGITVVDDIGLCTLVASLCVPQLARREFCERVALFALIGLAIAWLGNVFWMPHQLSTAALENLLIGGNAILEPHSAHTPVLQYVALYVIGLPVGHYFARSVSEPLAPRVVAAQFFTIGVTLVGLAIPLRGFRHFYGGVAGGHAEALVMTLRVTVKTPPSPGYLLFFGGCAALLVALMFRASTSDSPRTRAALDGLAVIGRASFMVFVLQYYLCWTLPDWLGIPVNRYAILVFVANVLLIRLAAGIWTHFNGNRWLTFGIRLGGKPKTAERTSPG